MSDENNSFVFSEKSSKKIKNTSVRLEKDLHGDLGILCKLHKIKLSSLLRGLAKNYRDANFQTIAKYKALEKAHKKEKAMQRDIEIEKSIIEELRKQKEASQQ